MKILSTVILCSLLVLESRHVFADAETADSSPTLGGKIQMLGVMEHLKDPYADDYREYLFIRQARINVSGTKNTFKYYVAVGFAGEEETVVANPGVAINLLDFSVDMPLSERSFVKVGQFKVPYSRERLANSGYLQFANRSIQNLGFRVGRDVGVAFHSYPGNFAFALGVFTGGGRDIPERYLPEHLGFPLAVIRFGLNNGHDQDVFSLKQQKLNVEKSESGIFINALYTKDSLVGHSTVSNVKLAEKSLLTNSNWNPYINRAPLEKSDFWQAGLDGAYRIPTSWGSYSMEAEWNFGKFQNAYGSLSLMGGRVQGGALVKPFEYSLRYAYLQPDDKFAYVYTDATTKKTVSKSITGKKLIHELSPGISYFFEKQNAKLILDFPMFIQVPVAVEDSVGAYVLTEHPDQTSILSKDTAVIERQNVYEARLMFQMIF